MSNWKEVAVGKFPELKQEIEWWAPTPDNLWTLVLHKPFVKAHEKPMDSDFIRRVY